MTQPDPQKSVVARDAVWIYRGATEEATEKDFFTAMKADVATAIARRLQSGERIWVGREMRLQVNGYTMQARLTNLEPVSANVVGEATRTIAQYQERPKDQGQDVSTFIAEIIRYPDKRQGRVYAALVGLGAIQKDLYRKLWMLLQAGVVDHWANNIYGATPPTALMQVIHDRYPLLILEGQVGSGKTALARSIGHGLATELHSEVALVVVNAQVRGGGHVGELTKNISRAFEEAKRIQEREQIPVILLIDEADALAQARGGRQTHHEDDAGVNALIQCIDQLRGKPMAVLFATNLSQTLDPAIVRRAVATYHFDRPNIEQRAEVFARVLQGLNVSQEDINTLANATEPRALPGFGAELHRYTYSDLTQRIIPSAVERAVWERQPLSIAMLREACATIPPTPEMRALGE